MGCNCNKGKAAQKYKYTGPDGKSKTYNTEVEAQAAKIRNGGGSYVPVAA